MSNPVQLLEVLSRCRRSVSSLPPLLVGRTRSVVASPLARPWPILRIVQSGALHAQLRAEQVVLRKGQVAFEASGARLRPVVERSAFACVVIKFFPKSLRLLQAKGSRQARGVQDLFAWTSSSPAPELATTLVELLTTLANEGDPAEVGGALCQALLQVAEHHIETDTPAGRGKAFRTWQAVAMHIDEHLEGPLSCGAVGAALGIHPGHVSRLCQQHAGKGFAEYVTGERLRMAQELLRTTRLGVKEVATATGFRSAGYFIKAFRRHLGTTPGRFRTQDMRSAVG